MTVKKPTCDCGAGQMCPRCDHGSFQISPLAPSGFQLAISDFEQRCGAPVVNFPEVGCGWPASDKLWCARHAASTPRKLTEIAPSVAILPPPQPGSAVPTWELVVGDMRARDALGGAKYGVRHQHDNGRDHLTDLYQEQLDSACYVRAEIERRRITDRNLVKVMKALAKATHALEHVKQSPLWINEPEVDAALLELRKVLAP